MIGAVIKRCLNTYHRIACQHALIHTFIKPFFNGREKVFGNSTADNSFGKFKLFTVIWFKFDKDIAELTMTAALGVSALAADKPEGWTPADGARGPMLISANPNAGGYDKVITVSGQAVESFEFSKDVPG